MQTTSRMFKIFPRDVIYLLLYAIPNTILSFAILYIINNALSGNPKFLTNQMGWLFIGIVLATYLVNIVFQKKLNQYSFQLLYKNEKEIFRKILQAQLASLEKFGSQRFYTVVEDIRLFAWIPETVTHTINNILMLILCIAYLFLLSVKSAVVILVLILLLSGFYFLIINSMSGKVRKLRKQNETYYKYVNDLIKGFKELKMSTNRRINLMNKYLGPNRDVAEQLDFKINFTFLSINIISQYGLYVVLGIVLFLLPQIGMLNQANVIQYVVIILFIAGPINNLINMQNIYTRLFVSNQRINKFLEDFKSEAPAPKAEDKISSFKSLEFKEIEYKYKIGEETTFMLGPINLTINQGETIFIIGGNGSGKSTFINLLTGLYQPHGGQLILNNHIEQNYNENFQELTTSIFTNNHLFSQNYDDYILENNPRYKKLLKLMELNNVVDGDKDASARRSFSKGQSKRMSMIFALLECKPVLVLDEWAADQDPHFRKYFYEKLLPQLKAQGKTIIAVTHDDAYFQHADRIIKFDYGKIVKDFEIINEKELINQIWYAKG